MWKVVIERIFTNNRYAWYWVLYDHKGIKVAFSNVQEIETHAINNAKAFIVNFNHPGVQIQSFQNSQDEEIKPQSQNKKTKLSLVVDNA